MERTKPVHNCDVVVVGGINTDFLARGRRLPQAGSSVEGNVFLSGPGGKGANAAVAAARLGTRSAIIGRVGDDERGRALLSALAEEGVDAGAVSLDRDTPTGAALIQVDEAGQKQILAALGANLKLRVEHIDAAADLIHAARVLVVQLEVPVDCVAAAARHAGDAGVRIVLDPAPPRPLPAALISACEVVRGSAVEIEALTHVRVRDRATARDGARALIDQGVRAVVVGVDDGNLLVWRDGEQWLPERPVKTVDTTGAGDAFSATLAVALVEGRTLIEAGRRASAAAAVATTALGAQAGLARRAELDAYLARWQTLADSEHRSA